MATLAELLHPQVVFASVTNRVRKTSNVLQRFWNMQVGGPNFERIQGRAGSYDIFDFVRDPAGARAPNTGPATIAPQAIHVQPVTCVRIYEKMPLLYERIFPIRRLGRPSSEVDPGGADYVERQKDVLATRMYNTREFLLAGLMRGTCQFLISNDDWIPVFSGGTITIDQQIPAGNKNQVTGSIASTWDNTTAATIFEDVLAVNTFMLQQTGWPLRHIWINSVVWSLVTNNAGIKARSGSANKVFSVYDGLGQIVRGDFAPDEHTAELVCLPGIHWHIYDNGLSLNGTFTKFFPDTMAVFCPEPESMLATGIQGTEFVQENEMQPAQERQMPYFWPQYTREPAKIELCGMDIFVPVLRVPKSLCPATVVF